MENDAKNSTELWPRFEDFRKWKPYFSLRLSLRTYGDEVAITQSRLQAIQKPFPSLRRLTIMLDLSLSKNTIFLFYFDRPVASALPMQPL